MSYWNSDLYNKTLWFAAHAHKDQKIPGQEISYLLHLSQVCQESLGAALKDPQLDIDLVMCCALLHDVIEDTDCSYEEVERHFGDAVAAGVLALSKRPEVNGQTLTKSEQMADSLRRIQQQPPEVWVVKLADRIINLQTPPKHWSIDKIRRYHKEAQMIVDALGDSSLHLRQRFTQKLEAYQRYM